jgi:hypothetical protein
MAIFGPRFDRAAEAAFTPAFSAAFDPFGTKKLEKESLRLTVDEKTLSLKQTETDIKIGEGIQKQIAENLSIKQEEAQSRAWALKASQDLITMARIPKAMRTPFMDRKIAQLQADNIVLPEHVIKTLKMTNSEQLVPIMESVAADVRNNRTSIEEFVDTLTSDEESNKILTNKVISQGQKDDAKAKGVPTPTQGGKVAEERKKEFRVETLAFKKAQEEVAALTKERDNWQAILNQVPASATNSIKKLNDLITPLNDKIKTAETERDRANKRAEALQGKVFGSLEKEDAASKIAQAKLDAAADLESSKKDVAKFKADLEAGDIQRLMDKNKGLFEDEDGNPVDPTSLTPSDSVVRSAIEQELLGSDKFISTSVDKDGKVTTTIREGRGLEQKAILANQQKAIAGIKEDVTAGVTLFRNIQNSINIIDKRGGAVLNPTGALVGFANGAIEQIKALVQTGATVLGDDSFSFESSKIREYSRSKEFNKFTNDYISAMSLKGIAIDRALLQSNLIKIAYTLARLEEPGGRTLSNQDVVNNMKRIAATNGDPDAMIAVMRNVAREGLIRIEARSRAEAGGSTLSIFPNEGGAIGFFSKFGITPSTLGFEDRPEGQTTEQLKIAFKNKAAEYKNRMSLDPKEDKYLSQKEFDKKMANLNITGTMWGL